MNFINFIEKLAPLVVVWLPNGELRRGTTVVVIQLVLCLLKRYSQVLRSVFIYSRVQAPTRSHLYSSHDFSFLLIPPSHLRTVFSTKIKFFNLCTDLKHCVPPHQLAAARHHFPRRSLSCNNFFIQEDNLLRHWRKHNRSRPHSRSSTCIYRNYNILSAYRIAQPLFDWVFPADNRFQIGCHFGTAQIQMLSSSTSTKDGPVFTASSQFRIGAFQDKSVTVITSLPSFVNEHFLCLLLIDKSNWLTSIARQPDSSTQY